MAENGMQDVGMQGVQGQSKGTVQKTVMVRSIDVGAVLFHNRHISRIGTTRKLKECRLCYGELGSVVVETEETYQVEDDGVGKSSGADESKADTPASDSGWYYKEGR